MSRIRRKLVQLVVNISRILTLALGQLLGGVLAVQDSTTILIQLQFGDHNIGWVNPDIHRGAIALLTGDTLDVNNVLLTVHLDHLAFTSTLATTHNNHLVVLADWHGLDVILAAEVLVQVGAHNLAPSATCAGMTRHWLRTS